MKIVLSDGSLLDTRLTTQVLGHSSNPKELFEGIVELHQYDN
ncbi:hypothetical protein O9993_16300 [Vibrio lentus]|nr:hypothetical protein [Vibrio lentus]